MNRLFLAVLIIGVLATDVFCQPKTSSTNEPTSKSTPKSTPKSTTTTKTTKFTTTKKPAHYKTTTFKPSSTVSVQQWTDPNIGGKSSNPGARITLPSKTIDAVHTWAAENISQSIKNVSIDEFTLSIGTGQLTIKPPQITDSKLAKSEKELIPTNRIRSRFSDGQFKVNGQWSFKPAYNHDSMMDKVSKLARAMSSALNGTYKATITNGELKAINQFGRSTDAKPTIQLVDCKANFSQYKIEVESAQNKTVIENCVDPICNKIRSYFEEAACEVVRTFVKESINKKLATYQSQIDLQTKNQSLNYGLLYNQPKVTEDNIQTGTEGKVTWRSSSNVPFSANDLTFVDKQRPVSLELSDYTFNTLLHQAHSQNYRLSAAELLSKMGEIQQLLLLNCTNAKVRRFSKVRRPINQRQNDIGISSSFGVTVPKSEYRCLGELLQNVTTTTSSIDQYSSNVTGDLVYKTNQKGASIIVQSDKSSFFDASNGVLEFYGPSIDGKQRQLLYKADVKLLRGYFIPKLNGINVTGQVKLNQIQITRSSGPGKQPQDEQWFDKLGQFVLPIINDMYNTLLNSLAQFPVPMLDGFECGSPNMIVSPRTIQIDCDVRFSASRQEE